MLDRRTIRALHVITSTQRRGAESFAMALCGSLEKRGHPGRVVALTRAPGSPELDVPALGERSLSPTTLVGLRKAARDVDVVIAHGSRTLPASVLALAWSRRPIVYVNIGDPLYWAGAPLRRLRVRRMLGRVRAVAALTASSREVLVSHFGKAPDDVQVIPNGRNAVDFPPVDEEARARARQELGLPGGDVVLYLGALSPEKRPDLAVAAVAGLGSNATLVFAGDGPLREETEGRATAALGDRAVFLGNRPDAARLLAAADVLVLPSDSEGLPGVLIEAGLVGLPVVATDVGYVGDVVVHDRTGVLVPAGEAHALAGGLRRALERRTDMGNAARRHCLEHFEMERVVDSWEGLLADVST